jgi:hypothetical protein
MTPLKEWAERFKPSARAKTHLLAAALLWTVVGLGLAAAGLVWSFSSALPWSLLLAVAGIAAGTLKGRLVIRKMADWNTARIIARGDGRCLGGFLAPKTWLLIIVMMGSGILLRRSGVPRPILGVLYTAVGTGLLIGGQKLWKAWRETPGFRVSSK